jgi:iron complex transport system substrate-binding protein
MKTPLAIAGMLLLCGGAFMLSGDYGRGTDGGAVAKNQAKPAPAVEIIEEAADYRLVKHLLGSTSVPHAPQRIASLNSAITDSLVALGQRPVVVESSWDPSAPAAYLADRLHNVSVIGQGGAVNLEIIIAAKPDLIFIANAQDGRLFDQLGKIAPTVFLSVSEGAADRIILDVGAAIGMRAQAEKRLAEYEHRLAGARKSLAKSIGGEPVVFLRFRMNTCVIYSRGPTMVGPLLFDRLKLTPDPMAPAVMGRGGWDVLSVERLSMLRAEHLFAVVDRGSERYYEQVAATSIWRDIPAVKHGHVHHVAAGTWLSNGILAYEAVLDDLAAATNNSISPQRAATVDGE